MNQVNYYFENIQRFSYGLPPKKWIKKCVVQERGSIEILNFIFCSDKYLQSLNKKYLNKADLTDVIAFPHQYPDFFEILPYRHVSGDVFISIERIKENCKKYNTIFAKELMRVMIHGTLHLLGFKDSSKKEKLIMKTKEDIYIKVRNV